MNLLSLNAALAGCLLLPACMLGVGGLISKMDRDLAPPDPKRGLLHMVTALAAFSGGMGPIFGNSRETFGDPSISLVYLGLLLLLVLPRALFPQPAEVFSEKRMSREVQLAVQAEIQKLLGLVGAMQKKVQAGGYRDTDALDQLEEQLKRKLQ